VTLSSLSSLSSRPFKVRGLAVPVRLRRQVLACLVIRFPRSVVTREEVADRYLEPLNATAGVIVAALAAQNSAN
jgi:IclR family mhp operon transcriptional activator